MDILSAQTAIAQEHCAGDRFFSGAVGRLVDALMRDVGDGDWSGKFPNSVDGVIFETETCQADAFIGHGMVYVIGNECYLEPISAEFSFDPIKIGMIGGIIRFGMMNSERPRPGSSIARKIVQSVLAKASSSRPTISFDWRYEFSLIDREWLNSTSD